MGFVRDGISLGSFVTCVWVKWLGRSRAEDPRVLNLGWIGRVGGRVASVPVCG